MSGKPLDFHISEIPLFKVLTDEERTAIIKAGHLVYYSPGEVLFKQNTPVNSLMYVCRGLVKIIRDADHSKKCILHLSVEGDFIGLQTIFSHELYQYSAVAIENTRILMIDISELHRIISQNGNFASSLLRQASQEGIGIMTKLLNQFYKQLPGRVAEMLLFFSEKIYKSQVFQLPLTRQELAEFIGTTKESIIRTLGEFRHDKIIRLEGKKVEIISPDIINTLNRLG
jgi:CRP-like cAMP-binding protein